MVYKLGTHLVATRTGYTHHGIYIGDRRVIHYAGLAKGLAKDKIRIVSLTGFRNNGTVSVYEYSYLLENKRYSGPTIVSRAKSRVGENNYRILWNNCETFANWCTHGDEYSTQTDGKAHRLIDLHTPLWFPKLPTISPIRNISRIGRFMDKLF